MKTARNLALVLLCVIASAQSQAPTAPSGLTVTGSTQTSVAISWTAASDNVGVSGYGVYQGGSSWVGLGS